MKENTAHPSTSLHQSISSSTSSDPTIIRHLDPSIIPLIYKIPRHPSSIIPLHVLFTIFDPLYSHFHLCWLLHYLHLLLMLPPLCPSDYHQCLLTSGCVLVVVGSGCESLRLSLGQILKQVAKYSRVAIDACSLHRWTSLSAPLVASMRNCTEGGS